MSLSPAGRAKIEKLMGDPRYWDSNHPEHGEAVENVTRAFQEAYPEPSSRVTKSGAVHVRSYTRHQDGKTTTVSNYDRSAPRNGDSVTGDDRPVSAHAEGRRVIYANPDGSQDVREGGTSSWRTNNPGNIEYGRFAREHGAIGRSGHFAVFPTEQEGRRALEVLLHRPDFQSSTLDSAIANYAPKNENDTFAYQHYVRKSLGVNGSTRLKDLTPSQMNELVRSIIIFEGWKVGTTRRIEKQK